MSRAPIPALLQQFDVLAAAAWEGTLAVIADFDGVLARIEKGADGPPRIDQRTAVFLAALANRGNTIGIDTGRLPQSVAEELKGWPNLQQQAIIAGAYGRAWHADGRSWVHPTAQERKASMNTAIASIEPVLRHRGLPFQADGRTVERKTVDGVPLAYRWSREFHPNLTADHLAVVRGAFQEVADREGLSCTSSDIACELYCPGIDKGTAATELLDHHVIRDRRAARQLAVEAVLCIGDEGVDGTMFDAVKAWAAAKPEYRTAATVFVNSDRRHEPTLESADLVLSEQAEVAGLFARLAAGRNPLTPGYASDITLSPGLPGSGPRS